MLCNQKQPKIVKAALNHANKISTLNKILIHNSWLILITLANFQRKYCIIKTNLESKTCAAMNRSKEEVLTKDKKQKYLWWTLIYKHLFWMIYIFSIRVSNFVSGVDYIWIFNAKTLSIINDWFASRPTIFYYIFFLNKDKEICVPGIIYLHFIFLFVFLFRVKYNFFHTHKIHTYIM